ncbi:MAG: ABC transporter ATP-binding protein [Candidatus Kryptoniota bacterium]
MLEVRDLRKTFASTIALDRVSFKVKPGEIFGLLGPNGAGKTTTIRISLGILEPDAGIVLFNGEQLTDELKDKLAYLPEERGLYRKSRVLDVLVYFAGLRGIPVFEARKKAVEWLKRFELGVYANRKVEELSKGMQQKVQFISCLLHNPELLILDEPFSGLDPVNQMVLKDTMREMKASGKTIVFSTHQMEQAEKLCDRICLIDRGKVVLYGELSEIKKQYGSNSIHLEFDGESTKLRDIRGAVKIDLYENYAEIKTDGEASSNDILKQVVDLVNVRKFSVEEASLNSIFIQVVGGDNVN